MTWAEFKNAVKNLMSDQTISDDTAVRAIADYVRAKSLIAFGGDQAQYAATWAGYLEQRKNLLGYSTTLDQATLRARVRELLTDTAVNDTTAVLAVSTFVKAEICRHVDKNPALADSHFAQWLRQRNRLLGFAITLTTDALRAEVSKLLTVDANRAGIAEFTDQLILQASTDLAGLAVWVDAQIDQGNIDLAGSADFIDKTIRQGAIDLESNIDFYRQNHETQYETGDVTIEGEASGGGMPPGGMIRDAYYYTTDTPGQRMPVKQYDWQNRFDLVFGSAPMDGLQFYIAIDPTGSAFLLFPPLLAGNSLSIFWDGTKVEFEDDDEVPFDEDAAAAIADYTQARMYLRPSSMNAKLAAIHDAEFTKKRLLLYRSARDRVRVRDNNDSPSPLPKHGCGSCAVVSGPSVNPLPVP